MLLLNVFIIGIVAGLLLARLAMWIGRRQAERWLKKRGHHP